MINKILRDITLLKDEKYRLFQCSLVPTIAPDTVIGVRTPELRKLASRYKEHEGVDEFLHSLPHRYYEENNLHAFLIEQIPDFDTCVRELDLFLPYIDNWATCDSMRPKCFKKHRKELTAHIQRWISSSHTYTVRYGIGMLMVHYLDEDFNPEHLKTVASIKSDEYYVNMMIAWYFSTALAKQFQTAVPYIEKRLLDGFTHNKAIQKAIESYRITPEQKAYLRTLK